MSDIIGRIRKSDHTLKIAKVLDVAGSQSMTTLWLAYKEFGQVLTQSFVLNTGLEQIGVEMTSWHFGEATRSLVC